MNGLAVSARAWGWRHATRRISRTQDGRRPNGASYYPAISADGGVIAFVSTATDLADARRRPSQPAVFLYEVASARIARDRR